MCELSVIVPVYNVSEYLEKCLNSILAQTYGDFEVICVDDGSTDNSLEILRNYENRDKRIKVLHKDNGGLVSARKAGIAVAQGRYATYVDSDDWIDAEMYACLMGHIKDTNADIVTSGLVLEYPNGVIVELEEMEEGEYEGERLNSIFYPNMISTKEFFVQNVSMHIFNKIYKTELLREKQMGVPDDITICEDAACVYPYFLEANKIVVIHKAFYHYRMRESSMMGTCEKKVDSFKDIYTYLNKTIESSKDNFWQEQLCRLILFMMLMIQPKLLWYKGDMLPFSKIEKGKFVIYGMGRFGAAFKKALEDQSGYDIVAIVDQNRKQANEWEKCYTLEEFLNLKVDYDYILITILKRNICRNVKNKMIESGISGAKILEPNIENAVKIVETIR